MIFYVVNVFLRDITYFMNSGVGHTLMGICGTVSGRYALRDVYCALIRVLVPTFNSLQRLRHTAFVGFRYVGMYACVRGCGC